MDLKDRRSPSARRSELRQVKGEAVKEKSTNCLVHLQEVPGEEVRAETLYWNMDLYCTSGNQRDCSSENQRICCNSPLRKIRETAPRNISETAINLSLSFAKSARLIFGKSEKLL